jgi:hypothetical protein
VLRLSRVSILHSGRVHAAPRHDFRHPRYHRRPAGLRPPDLPEAFLTRKPRSLTAHCSTCIAKDMPIGVMSQCASSCSEKRAQNGLRTKGGCAAKVGPKTGHLPAKVGLRTARGARAVGSARGAGHGPRARHRNTGNAPEHTENAGNKPKRTEKKRDTCSCEASRGEAAGYPPVIPRLRGSTPGAARPRATGGIRDDWNLCPRQAGGARRRTPQEARIASMGLHARRKKDTQLGTSRRHCLARHCRALGSTHAQRRVPERGVEDRDARKS